MWYKGLMSHYLFCISQSRSGNENEKILIHFLYSGIELWTAVLFKLLRYWTDSVQSAGLLHVSQSIDSAQTSWTSLRQITTARSVATLLLATGCTEPSQFVIPAEFSSDELSNLPKLWHVRKVQFLSALSTSSRGIIASHVVTLPASMLEWCLALSTAVKINNNSNNK